MFVVSFPSSNLVLVTGRGALVNIFRVFHELGCGRQMFFARNCPFFLADKFNRVRARNNRVENENTFLLFSKIQPSANLFGLHENFEVRSYIIFILL